MQLQHHVNPWHRCEAVALCPGNLVCALDGTSTYDLVESYDERPHLEFLNVKNDLDLAVFVRSWGPLWSIRDGPTAVIAVRPYWLFHQWLKALVHLINEFRSGRDLAGLRKSLIRYALAADERSRALLGVEGFDLQLLRIQFFSFVSCDPDRWFCDAGMSVLREAASFCVSGSLKVVSGLQATWKPTPPRIGWRSEVENLEDAIKWMVWHDIAGRRPLTFCHECGNAFIPESAHMRKYCGYECSHRVAAREWRRRDLRKNKERRRTKQ